MLKLNDNYQTPPKDASKIVQETMELVKLHGEIPTSNFRALGLFLATEPEDRQTNELYSKLSRLYEKQPLQNVKRQMIHNVAFEKLRGVLSTAHAYVKRYARDEYMVKPPKKPEEVPEKTQEGPQGQWGSQSWKAFSDKITSVASRAVTRVWSSTEQIPQSQFAFFNVVFALLTLNDKSLSDEDFKTYVTTTKVRTPLHVPKKWSKSSSRPRSDSNLGTGGRKSSSSVRTRSEEHVGNQGSEDKDVSGNGRNNLISKEESDASSPLHSPEYDEEEEAMSPKGDGAASADSTPTKIYSFKDFNNQTGFVEKLHTASEDCKVPGERKIWGILSKVDDKTLLAHAANVTFIPSGNFAFPKTWDDKVLHSMLPATKEPTTKPEQNRYTPADKCTKQEMRFFVLVVLSLWANQINEEDRSQDKKDKALDFIDQTFKSYNQRLPVIYTQGTKSFDGDWTELIKDYLKTVKNPPTDKTTE